MALVAGAGRRCTYTVCTYYSFGAPARRVFPDHLITTVSEKESLFVITVCLSVPDSSFLLLQATESTV